LSSKIAFYLSLVAFFFACLAILDLVAGEGVAGWLFTIGAIGNSVSVPLAIILEQSSKE
jgi:hypothetical protein